jgi:hypothetical protein
VRLAPRSASWAGAYAGLSHRQELKCGSVDEYVVKTGILRLKHDYPPSGASVIANIDIEHVLERAKHNELDVGTWLNVIGNVERRRDKGVFVQAVTIWDAGNVDLDAYQKAVEKRKEVS